MCIDNVNVDLNVIISDRLAKDNDLFFVDTSIVDSKFDKEVIRKKDLYGVQYNGCILLQPIFENIEIVSRDIAIVQVLNRFAIYSLSNCQKLSDFEYPSIRVSNDMIVLSKANGRSSLFNLNTSEFILQSCDYEEFNTKDNSTEYLWASKNGFYDYIHRSTGRIVSLPGVTMAYDTKHGIYGRDIHNKICKFNEHGVADYVELRLTVQKAGGYLTLHNYTYNIEHVIDIYGNIINI